MFTEYPFLLSPPTVLLPVPVVNALLPLPPKALGAQLHLTATGLALVHRTELHLDEQAMARMLEAWRFAEVRLNLLEPLEGIPMVLLAAQAGQLPALVADVSLAKLSPSIIEKWLRQAESGRISTLQLVVLEPLGEASKEGVVRCSRSLTIPSQSFWRPLLRVLREQQALIQAGDASMLTVAAKGILARQGAAAGVLAGGPVGQELF